MSTVAKIKVYGKVYNVKNDSTSIDLHEAANLVDSKMQELSKAKSIPSTMDLAILTALNIAQELLELKREIHSDRKQSDEKAERLVSLLSREIKSLENRSSS